MSPLIARTHRVPIIIAPALLTLPALLVAIPATASPASAHTDLVGSTPAAGDRVARAPGTVELVFSEDVSPDLAAVVLSVGSRQLGRLPVSQGRSTDTLLADSSALAVPDASSTTPWQVRFRVTSVDGHPIEGAVEFSVAAAPSTSSPSSPSSPSPEVSANTAAPQDETGAGAVSSAPDAIPAAQESAAGLPIAAALVVVVLALPLLLVVGARRLRARRAPSGESTS